MNCGRKVADGSRATLRNLARLPVRISLTLPVGDGDALARHLDVGRVGQGATLTRLAGGVGELACANGDKVGLVRRISCNGRLPRLFDPASGACAARWLVVTVRAPDATTADALSTALSVVPADRVPVVLAAYPAVAIRFTHPDGRILRLPA
ncbi:FAD:protein FMN transferase [Azospirillum endophyticum]